MRGQKRKWVGIIKLQMSLRNPALKPGRSLMPGILLHIRRKRLNAKSFHEKAG
jgi:hypothetical protein